MDKMQKTICSVITVLVLFVMGVFFLCNIINFLKITKNQLQATEGLNVNFTTIEDEFRENVFARNQLVDTYGMVQRMLGHNIVGNFEYVADDYGILHMINDYSPYDVDYFLQEMGELQKYLREKDIPLIYVQAPNREVINQGTAIDEFNLDEETMDEVVEGLKELGISVLDIRENLLKDDNRKFELTDLYFHTDLHMQTDAEIWMAAQVAEYLAQTEGIMISNEVYLLDFSNYEKYSYDFLGNYGRTNGRKFVKLDVFDIYHPIFPTLLSYEVPGDPTTYREGPFVEILMYGYESLSYDEYIYWVTNFMKFTLPYYSITNQYQEDVNILVITDSIAYRGLSYLSLTAHKITILDPRFFNGTDYLEMALEDEYDVVLVWQGNYLIGNEII